MRANVLLVKWEDGMMEIDGSGSDPRSERYVELGGVLTRTEATTLASELLAVVKQPRGSVTVEGLPLGEGGGADDAPFRVGQSVNIGLGGPMLVKAMAWTLGEDGTLRVIPELVSALDLRSDEVDRILARYASGNAGGSNVARPATPGPPSGSGGRIYELPPYSCHGSLLAATGIKSPGYVPARPVNLIGVAATLGTASSSGNVQIAWYVNEDLGGTFVIPVLLTIRIIDLPSAGLTTLLLGTDTLRWSILDPGTGAADLTIQVRASVA